MEMNFQKKKKKKEKWKYVQIFDDWISEGMVPWTRQKTEDIPDLRGNKPKEEWHMTRL